MSQTPEEIVEADRARNYSSAWQTILGWTEKGRTWSGHERHCCFLNMRDSTFADISSVAGVDFDDDGRGVAIVDWDHDGRLDLWMTSRTAPQVRFLRNELPGCGHYLAIRLVGDSKNLDAIGARVAVTVDTENGAEQRIVRSLRAGEGFLSQSTKWLHFGLGGAKVVSQVEIDWPNGQRQTMNDLDGDSSLVIRQGKSKPELWTRPTPCSLAHADPKLAVPSEQLIHTLAARFPLNEEVTFRDQAGQQRSVDFSTSKAKLILLWASWCSPCRDELVELARAKKDLDAQRLEVVALSVDGVGPSQSEWSTAVDWFETQDIPYVLGQADEATIAQLQSVNDQLFMAKRPLPLPSSFLVDEKARVVSIYKGRVKVERLVDDLSKIKLSGVERMQKSLLGAGESCQGTWISTPLIAHDEMMVEQGRQLAQTGNPIEAEKAFRSAIEFESGNATARYYLGNLLAQQGNPGIALLQFEKAVELAPDMVEARLRLGDLYLANRKIEKAREQFAAVVASHNHADALGKLGLIAASSGNLSQAEKYFRSALAAAPSDSKCQANLGKVLLDLGKHEESTQHLRSAIQQKSPALAPMLNLIWILSAGDASVRDGAASVQLAEKCRSLYPNVPQVYDRLAAALAEIGDFEKAIAAIDQGMQYAAKSPAVQTMLTRHRLELMAKRPLRISPTAK